MKELIKQSVGIDISMEFFIACVCRMYKDQSLSFSKSKKFKNTETGFKEFLEWVKKQTEEDIPVNYLMEATGVYYEELSYFLHDQGCMLHVLLPNKSKNYFKSLNVKTKTDNIDAKYLSQFGAERSFPKWEPAQKIYRRLRSLTRCMNRFQDQKTALSNQLHSVDNSYAPDKFVRKSYKSVIAKLNKEINNCLKEIKELLNSDSEIKSKVDKLCTINGIGLKTVASVVAETQGFFMFKSRKQLVSFAGYDVVENQSGSSIRGKTRISKKGNKYIRRALYFPAISASIHSPEIKIMFHRIIDKRHIKMVSYVAIQRKLLTLMFTLWKKDEAYDITKVASS